MCNTTGTALVQQSHNTGPKRISEPARTSGIPRNKWLNLFLSKFGGKKGFSQYVQHK